jgi:hypothetical protein
MFQYRAGLVLARGGGGGATFDGRADGGTAFDLAGYVLELGSNSTEFRERVGVAKANQWLDR